MTYHFRASQCGKFVTISVDELEQLVENVFLSAGCNSQEARSIAFHLVKANATGHDSHGVGRVIRYLQWMKEGKLLANQTPTIATRVGSMAIIDGQQGFGQTVGPYAVDLGIDIALEQGIAFVGIRRSGHLGRIGDWSERAADKGLISVHFVNVHGHLVVAPFGGTERRMSTAPISIGVPRKNGNPLILDFATSIIAEGKVMVASKKGDLVRDDALITPEGELSGNPHDLYGDTPDGMPPDPDNGLGAIQAFGEHKGSGLSFMCETLAGIVTGSGFPSEKTKPHELWSGMFSIYIDPSKLDEAGELGANVSSFVDYYKSSQANPNGTGVYVPGDVERLKCEKAESEGITLPVAIWNDINQALERLSM